MGSRALFHLTMELGYEINQHVNLSVYYEHYSMPISERPIRA
jgi:hypothetical protein